MSLSSSLGSLPRSLESGTGKRLEAGMWVGLHIVSRHHCTFSLQARRPDGKGEVFQSPSVTLVCCIYGVSPLKDFFFLNTQGTIWDFSLKNWEQKVDFKSLRHLWKWSSLSVKPEILLISPLCHCTDVMWPRDCHGRTEVYRDGGQVGEVQRCWFMVQGQGAGLYL